jgi:hypothetical protein
MLKFLDETILAFFLKSQGNNVSNQSLNKTFCVWLIATIEDKRSALIVAKSII